MTSGRTSHGPAGISLANWLSPPYAHWSFQHVEDFVPTAVVSRGTGRVAALPAAGTAVAEIPVTTAAGPVTTVGAVMATTATDGWAVAHRGSMMAEDGHGIRSGTGELRLRRCDDPQSTGHALGCRILR